VGGKGKRISSRDRDRLKVTYIAGLDIACHAVIVKEMCFGIGGEPMEAVCQYFFSDNGRSSVY
jgi:hypothetical protein